MKKQILFVALFFVLLCWLPSVNRCQTNPLQAIIDEAAAGAVIAIPHGNYVGKLLINKPLVLFGDGSLLEESADNTVALDIRSSNVSVYNFTVHARWLAVGVRNLETYAMIQNVNLRDLTIEGSHGISLWNTSDVTIEGCQLTNCTLEISRTTRAVIKNCHITNYCIYLNQWNSFCQIINNTVENNAWGGYGLTVQDSWNNTIQYNTFRSTLVNVQVYYNIISNPLPKNSCNLFNMNNFIRVNQQARLVSAPENTPRDFWDNGTCGNYWSEYRDTDLNGDGIWDRPYFMDKNITDHFPLVKATVYVPDPAGSDYYGLMLQAETLQSVNGNLTFTKKLVK
jgi:parallel beta-helix repeat protein